MQDVDDFGGGGGLGGVVNVGEDREVEIGFNFGEDAETFGETRTTKGFNGGAVGFVVGGFEDVGDPGVSGDFCHAFGHGTCVGLGFDYARAGDEEEGIVAAEAERAEGDFAGVCH